MKVILQEDVRNLGQLGEEVKVRPGFARNYLFPKSIAIPATKSNVALFQERLAELKKIADEKLSKAKERAQAIDELKSITIAVRASDEGRLYGSLGPREVSHYLKSHGHEVLKQEVQMPSGAIRLVGEYEVQLVFHSDVLTTLSVTVVAE